MYKLIRGEFENFIGIYNGLGKKKLELDLTDHTDKSIFIILGGNAHGKSTLISILHPFSGTTDKRDKFIRENKEGYKQLLYIKQDDSNTQIKIRHTYIPNKTGTHSTKSFIFKIVNGEELDLNPNGNVSSFLSAIEQEFGITEDFLKLSAQNNDMVGIVNMTGANRKDHLYKFIPKVDDTLLYQKIVSKKYRDIRIFLSSIIDKLGKMEDEVSVSEKLKDIEEQTNYLVEKRDKNIAKINNYKSEIRALDPQDSLISQCNTIKLTLKDLNEKQDKYLLKYNRILANYSEYENISIATIDSTIYNNLKLKSKKYEELSDMKVLISTKKQLKDSIYDTISEKESMIKQLSGDKIKSDINDLLLEYKNKLSKYDKRVKNLNTSLTSNDLILGIDIIENIRSYLIDLYNNSDNKKVLELACNASFSKKFENKYLNTKSKLDHIKDQISLLTINIEKLNAYEHLKDNLDKRPLECTIDSCKFLNEYHKWSAIEKKLIELYKELEVVSKDYEILIIEINNLTEIHILKLKLESLFTFYTNNYSILSKLPFNELYSTKDKLISQILDYNTLPGVEDDFYEIIEVLQDKKEYDDIRNIKVPILLNELNSLTKNEKLINSINIEIDNLHKKYDKNIEEMELLMEKFDIIENEYNNIVNMEDILLDLKNKLFNMDDNKKNIIELSKEFDRIKEYSEKLEILQDNIDERKSKLKIIESKLRPLTIERDKYKFQELKIREYKLEKEILEENLQIITLIRDALSTNKGMPVSVLNLYIDEIRRNTNMLLSEVFDGTIYLEKFEVNDKEFSIPFHHNGDNSTDISKASTSEKSFISTCLSMAMLEQIISTYGIISLDETDAGFNYQNKLVYCNILMKQIKRIGISQLHLITHSPEFYEPYSHELCYILFPEHNLNLKDKEYIKVY